MKRVFAQPSWTVWLQAVTKNSSLDQELNSLSTIVSKTVYNTIFEDKETNSEYKNMYNSAFYFLIFTFVKGKIIYCWRIFCKVISSKVHQHSHEHELIYSVNKKIGKTKVYISNMNQTQT